jgi:hypothetical protein
MDEIQRITDSSTPHRFVAIYQHGRLGAAALCVCLCACGEPGVASPGRVWSGFEQPVAYAAAGTILTRLGAAHVIGGDGVDQSRDLDAGEPRPNHHGCEPSGGVVPPH